MSDTQITVSISGHLEPGLAERIKKVVAEAIDAEPQRDLVLGDLRHANPSDYMAMYGVMVFIQQVSNSVTKMSDIPVNEMHKLLAAFRAGEAAIEGLLASAKAPCR